MVILSAGIILGACSTQTFRIAPQAGLVEREAYSQFFVGGLGQTDDVDAANICGGSAKVASIETSESFLNVLLGGLSSGIYTPRQYRVSCIR